MSNNEILAIIGGLIAGYWVMTKLLGRGQQTAPFEQNPPQEESDQDHSKSADGGVGPGPEFGSQSLSWWVVLQVEQSATEQEVRAAYKRLMSEYHPDKVAALGAELRELAERKSKQINEAYEKASLVSR